MKITSGRLSDILDDPGRIDWSEMNARLKALEPGAHISVECPPGVPLSKLRSTIITNGRRFDYGDWRLSTRRHGNAIRCFLVPSE